VKDLSVTLRRERTEGHWRVMMSGERVVRLEEAGDKKVVQTEEFCK